MFPEKTSHRKIFIDLDEEAVLTPTRCYDFDVSVLSVQGTFSLRFCILSVNSHYYD